MSDTENGKKQFRLIVAGSRTFDDTEFLSAWLDALIVFYSATGEVVLVSGGALGADALAERYAANNGVGIEVYPADWDTHGKAAGPKRNAQMASVGNALVVFWDGQSRGTKNMIVEARKHKIPIHIVHFY